MLCGLQGLACAKREAQYRSMTIALLIVALSLMPMTRTHVINNTMATAGRLNTKGNPNKCGADARALADCCTDAASELISPPAAFAWATVAAAWSAVL